MDWAPRVVVAGVAKGQLARRLHPLGWPSPDTTHGATCTLLTVMVVLVATMASGAATGGAMRLVCSLATTQGGPCRASSALREAVWWT